MTTPAPVLDRRADERADDIAEIRLLLADIESGVNARDPDRCVARFAADTVSVTASGARAVGREAVRAAHEAAFAGALKAVVAHFQVLDVLFVRDDVAIATTGAWAVQNGVAIDRDRPATVVTYVVTREPDGWWVAARQFTPATSSRR
jgi:uncharacterized protein (TIGR02246 family)